MILPRPLAVVLAALLTGVQADVQFTSPAAGASVSGTSIKVGWKDSGASPPLSTFETYQLFLCAGGNDPSTITVLSTLTSTGDFSTGNSFAATIDPGLGGTATNAYFLKMISTATNGVVINYSSRFSLPGMTGTFPATVQTALKSVSGTSGPSTQNQAAAVNNAGNGAAGAGAGAAAGDFGVAYTLQTGPTRYAPMPKLPGTKITLKNADPLYPASSYTVFTTLAPPAADAQITVTQPVTAIVSSMEPTIVAQPMPSDSDMQKFLNRWKD